MVLNQWDEAFKWFEITFKEYVEPVRGTFKNNESYWRKEFMTLLEKLVSKEEFMSLHLMISDDSLLFKRYHIIKIE